MTTLSIHAPDGSTQGSVDLPADIFDVQANTSLMHQVVVAQLAAKRAGTHKTKTRGEVSGGGAKPYRQKGTGRARQGSTRAPQFEGGGVVHGPKPRDYSQRTPKKMKAAALRGALSDRAREGRLHVVSTFVPAEAPSTKSALTVLGSVLADVVDLKRVLVVVEPDDVVSWKSLRNLSAVHLLDTGQLNTYDVLVSDHVVFTEAALGSFLARAGNKSRRGAGPDLSTPLVGGDLPSMVIAEADTAETNTIEADTAEADTAEAETTDAETETTTEDVQ